MARWTVFPRRGAAEAGAALAEQVERDGGHALALYREPVGEHWQIFCLLPAAQGRGHARTSATSRPPTSSDSRSA